jgi:NAD(P)-dependent dehydrogenase (short-subunit alcohol dehydrogenase family)
MNRQQRRDRRKGRAVSKSQNVPDQPSFPVSIALVTGANKGIGFEIARGLGARDVLVLLGSRDDSRGKKAAAQLLAEGINAQPLELDVTDRISILSAAAQIEAQFGRLDILVNNAGVNLEAGAKPSAVDLAAVRRVYDVNVFGVIAMTQAMLPFLLKSQRGRIVNVSSGLGSFGWNTDPERSPHLPLLLGYNSSKSALNAITVQFANELRGTHIKVNAACPGYCATDMTSHLGTRTAQQGSATPIRLATLPDDGPTGGVFDDNGPVPW